MGSSYYEKDGKGYCDVHFNSLFGHMCDKCGEPIYKVRATLAVLLNSGP